MSEAFTGEIRLFAGNYAPDNWHICDGSLLSISTYQALFALIATTYGGDGVNTFGLPDLRGRVPIHQNPTYPLASKSGAEIAVVTEANMPAHNHSFSAITDQASLAAPTSTAFLASTSGVMEGPRPLNLYQTQTTATSIATTVQLSPNAVSSEGGSQAHPNMMPTLALTYMICLNGIFPPQP